VRGAGKALPVFVALLVLSSGVFADSASAVGHSVRPGAGSVTRVPTGALPGATVVGNVTATGHTGAGHLRVFPCGVPVPYSSQVNFSPAVPAVANMVVAQAGSNGEICVYTSSAAHVVFDLAGVVSGQALPVSTPVRKLDTRSPTPPGLVNAKPGVFQKFQAAHAALGSGGVALGNPKGFARTIDNRPEAITQEFERGSLYFHPQYGINEVYGAIWIAYRNHGAASSKLGLPTSGEVSHEGGRKTTFEGGVIYWNGTAGPYTPAAGTAVLTGTNASRNCCWSGKGLPLVVEPGPGSVEVVRSSQASTCSRRRRSCVCGNDFRSNDHRT
jgi:hypothetical protein